MAPDAYLVAVWDRRSNPPAQGDAPQGLALAHMGPGVTIWVAANGGLAVRPIGAARTIIGDVFAPPDGSGDAAGPFDGCRLDGASLEAASRQLMHTAWGRYVLIANEPGETGAFRDPSGALDCVTWRAGGVRYFASRVPTELDFLLPRDVAIDWATVARQLREPIAVSGAAALHGLEAIAPGALWVETSEHSATVRQLWRPADLARSPEDGDPAARLRACVQTCVATLVQPQSRVLSEISGGLDSAIVAACVTRAARQSDRAPATSFINLATDEIEGDERPYALAIASKLGVALTVRRKTGLRYTEAALTQVGCDVRVGLTALDPDYDAELIAAAMACGAEVIVTGQGGDAVFQQMAVGDVLVDRLRGQRRLDVDELLAHGRRTRQSVWRVSRVTLLRAAWPARRRRPVRSYLSNLWLPKVAPHPWLEQIQGLPPAKAAQVGALVASQNVFGPSPRSSAVRVLHPLLSQPVVELALQLPSYVLTRGGEDRALAREAFAEDLPERLLKRRSKGSLQAFYGRAIADSLQVLRPWLLEGLLVRHGLIEAGRLEPLLDPDVLIVRDLYVDLLHLAAVEAWARGWSQRIDAIRRLAPARV